MQSFLIILALVALFMIFWAMIGYPISIKLIDNILKPKENLKLENSNLSVTVMIVAHNEEKVIEEKLENVIDLNYPESQIKYLVTSDNSTDQTNEIVERFISAHPEKNIKLFKAKKRMGKTNAQNEAQKIVDTDILVMTDANAMLEKNSVKEIVSSFSSEDIVYVAGKLTYSNANTNSTSESESTYWDSDLAIRDVESRLQTITAGNGALYAVRNKDYKDFDPINSHDSVMPTYYALNNKRAIFNKDAVAVEKAGETDSDEFGRKVRMNRIILSFILPSIRILNIFKYRWYTYFYLGHRSSRYLLWLNHILLLLTSAVLSINNGVFRLLFGAQILFFLIALLQHYLRWNNKFAELIHYYAMTLLAQLVGIYKILTGNSKPFWEKAESTR